MEASPGQAVLAYLSSQGYAPEEKKQGIAVERTRVTAATINRELVLQGFEVTHLSVYRPSLEELFLKITKERNV